MRVTTEVAIYRFSKSQRQSLTRALEKLTYPVKGPFGPFVTEARAVLGGRLPAAVHQHLESFKNAASGPCALVLEECPFDTTITRGLLDSELDFPVKPNSLSEAFLVGLAAQIGEPYSIEQEGKSLVNNVCPSRAHLTQFTGLGSRERLGLHIENAAARTLAGDRAPDGLALTGISKEGGVSPATFMADGRLAIRLLRGSIERELRGANFLVQVPKRWQSDAAAAAYRTPIIVGPPHLPSFVAAFYGGLIIPMTPKARHALGALAEALEAVTIGVVIEPGVTVVIDNHCCFHGRGSFEAAFDGDGRPHRWLQRVFWTSSLRRLGPWPRVVDRVVRAEPE